MPYCRRDNWSYDNWRQWYWLRRCRKSAGCPRRWRRWNIWWPSYTGRRTNQQVCVILSVCFLKLCTSYPGNWDLSPAVGFSHFWQMQYKNLLLVDLWSSLLRECDMISWSLKKFFVSAVFSCMRSFSAALHCASKIQVIDWKCCFHTVSCYSLSFGWLIY